MSRIKAGRQRNQSFLGSKDSASTHAEMKLNKEDRWKDCGCGPKVRSRRLFDFRCSFDENPFKGYLHIKEYKDERKKRIKNKKGKWPAAQNVD